RYPHQKRSFIPSAVLLREGLKSTARPKMTQTVPSKSTANVFYQGTARPRVPHAVLSQSTGRPYYPRMDNIRPRTSSFSPSKRKYYWIAQAVLPQNVSVKGSAMINPTQTWRPKGAYLDSVNRDNGSYTLKKFEYVTPLGVSKSVMTIGSLKESNALKLFVQGNPEEDLKDYAIIDSGCSGSMTGDKDKLSDFKEFKGGYVAFRNDSKGGRISGKGTIKTSCLEGISMITELQVIDSPDGEYLIIHRENNHFRAFDTLWEILHVLDRQDLYHLYRVIDDYYEHIPPTGLGLMLLGDLTIIWETAESSDDDFWKDQEE
ncbi:hypothetical protein Tco_0631708, partial [Tanacetum coccineum]